MSDPLDQLEFASNPEPRSAAVLLLDTSGSMSGQPIAELNAGLKESESSTATPCRGVGTSAGFSRAKPDALQGWSLLLRASLFLATPHH